MTTGPLACIQNSHPRDHGLASAQQPWESPHFPVKGAAWEADKSPATALDSDAVGHLIAGPWFLSALQKQVVISSWQTPGTVFCSSFSGKGGHCSSLSQPRIWSKTMDNHHQRTYNFLEFAGDRLHWVAAAPTKL
jgi:hypothetical protein